MVTFLSSPTGYELPDKSIVPFIDYQWYSYKTSQTVAPGAQATLQSGAIQLASIPDYVMVWVSPKNYTGFTTGDWCAQIDNVTISFANQQGILSMAQPEQLWRMTQDNGLIMPFSQWRGTATQSARPTYEVTIGADTLALPMPQKVQTSGGPILLAFGKDIPLYPGGAPGVSDQNSFSVTVNMTNNARAPAVTSINKSGVTSAAATEVLYPTPAAQDVIVNMVTISSGMFVSQMGKSLRTTQPLTAPMMLQAMSDVGAHVSSQSVARLIGGGWTDRLSGFVSKAKQFYDSSKPYVSAAKRALESSGNEYAQKAAGALGAVGYGARSGAGRATGSGLETRFMD